MKLGLSSFTYGWAVGVAGHAPPQPLDAFGLLHRARAHGLSLVQFGDNLPLHVLPGNDLQRLRAHAQELGVELQTGARGLTPEHLRLYIELSRRLNARLLRFVIDARPYEPSPREVVSIVRDALPLLEAAHLTLGLENHDRFPVRVLRQIADEIDSPRVGVCLDTANSLGAGEGVEQVLDALSPVTVNLHIKEFAIVRVPSQMGFLVEGRPAGQGFMNWRDVLQRLPARCDSAVLEQWTPPVEGDLQATIAKEERWARESLEYLRGMEVFAEG